MRITGYYEKFSDKQYFIPYPLPPKDPPFELNSSIMSLYGDAMYELSKLNEMAKKLPNIEAFIKSYIIKEALLSSEIEGINTTLLDVLTQPILDTKPEKNTQLVMNYTKAAYEAISQIRQENLPIASRIIKKAHKTLLQGGEGDKSKPGVYRDMPVRVGNLLPAPTKVQIEDLMAKLEEFINLDQTLPAMIKAGLAHLQFETIHPFFDGNGRIGRLLIVLILIESNLLSDPIIYPSYYFKKHQLEYYKRLDSVRITGDFEGWVEFYLQAIKESSIDAYKRAKDSERLREDLRILINNKFGVKSSEIRETALSILFAHPVITVNKMAIELNVTYNTSKKIISDFIKLKIVVVEAKHKIRKIYKCKPYLDILEAEY